MMTGIASLFFLTIAVAIASPPSTVMETTKKHDDNGTVTSKDESDSMRIIEIQAFSFVLLHKSK